MKRTVRIPLLLGCALVLSLEAPVAWHALSEQASGVYAREKPATDAPTPGAAILVSAASRPVPRASR